MYTLLDVGYDMTIPGARYRSGNALTTSRMDPNEGAIWRSRFAVPLHRYGVSTLPDVYCSLGFPSCWIRHLLSWPSLTFRNVSSKYVALRILRSQYLIRIQQLQPFRLLELHGCGNILSPHMKTCHSYRITSSSSDRTLVPTKFQSPSWEFDN